MNKVVAICGDNESPKFYGFVFNNVQRASEFLMVAPYGQKPFKVLAESESGCENVIDCSNCNEDVYECYMCPKVRKLFQTENINEDFQENV